MTATYPEPIDLAAAGVECDCSKCVAMCRNVPCRGTPDEIQQAIDAGYGSQMYARKWVDLDEYYLIVGPAIRGNQRGVGTYAVSGTCALLTDDEKCQLHGTGFKPSEGRMATGCDKESDVRAGYLNELIESWNTPEGRAVAAEWVDRFGRP